MLATRLFHAICHDGRGFDLPQLALGVSLFSSTKKPH